MSNSYSFLFKYIVIGDSGVGKSCLVLQFVEQKIRLQHDITIGVEFGAKVLRINERNIKLQIWDTAGQENFRSITRSSAIGALLVFDISRRESFEHLSGWLEEMKQNGNPEMVVILIGNKCDVEYRQVSVEEGHKFAKDNDLMYVETSAKEAINVNEAFLRITQTIVDKIESKQIDVIKENMGIKVGQEYLQSQNDQNSQLLNVANRELNKDRLKQEIDISTANKNTCCE